jgi:enterochelin esterase family protein
VLIRVFIVGLVSLILVQASGQELQSPRLQAVRNALAQDSSGALESFWNEVKTKAPLIERLDEHQGYALVTFLWRGEPRTQHVSVGGQLGQLTGTHPADNTMARLAGTNVWYRSYWLRSDVRTIYRFFVEVEGNDGGRDYPDPFAPRWAPATGNNFRLEWSILELPRAKPQPWIARRPNVPAGRTDQRTWKSALLNNERQMWVYTPANYGDTRQRPRLLISTDGGAYVGPIQATTSLDNLIASKRIPPVVAVFLANGPNPSKGRLTRSIELSCNETFVNALATELLPWVRSNYRVTGRASETIIAGFSLGGVNAAFSALRKPALFGNVLSQSGAFWWRPPGEAESDWLAKQFASAPRSNVKFYMDVGLLEGESTGGAPLDWLTMADQPIPYGPSMLLANRHMRDILRLKGYHVHYAEFSGGHNALSWRGTFADALIALIGLTPSQPER